MNLEAVGKEIVDAAVKVHRVLGPGLLESAYQQCLVYELRQRGLNVKTEIVMPIVYEGYQIDAGYRLDVLVEDAVVVENHAFTKYGGNLGTDGSVAFMFKHCGQLLYAPGTAEDKLMDAAIEAGAEDVVTNDDGSIEVLTAPNDFVGVKEALEKAGFKGELAEVTMKPLNETPLAGDDAAKMQKLLDAIEALDMNFLNPGLLGNMEFFRNEFATPIDKFGEQDQKEHLRKLLYPFILPRTKEQVAKDLPEKTETILFCEMENEQRKIYEIYRNTYREKIMGTIDEQGIG